MIFLHRKGKTYVSFLLEEVERGKNMVLWKCQLLN